MAFRWETSQERSASRAAKEERKAEVRERLKNAAQARRREAEEKRRQVLTALLQPDEEVEALLQTAAAVMRKYVVLTSGRLIVAPVHEPSRAESIPYRAITSFGTSNFITRDVTIQIAGRRDRFELRFKSDEERDEALRVLQSHIV